MEPSQKTSKLLAQPLAIILLIMAAAFAITAVVIPVKHLIQSDSASATVNIEAAPSTQLLNQINTLPPDITLSPANDAGLTVVATVNGDEQPVPLYLRILTDLGTSVWALAVALITVLLAMVLASISTSNPFHLRNASRITWIALAILIGSVGADSLNLMQAHLLANYAGFRPPLDVVAYYSWTPVLLSLLMFVLAYAFRRGQEIQDDVEGLV